MESQPNNFCVRVEDEAKQVIFSGAVYSLQKLEYLLRRTRIGDKSRSLTIYRKTRHCFVGITFSCSVCEYCVGALFVIVMESR